VATVDMGVSKTGEPKDSFTRGFELHARVTMFGEGCRGSLTKSVDKKLGLWKESMAGFQTYGTLVCAPHLNARVFAWLV
jgi:electron-transferring-flavoprotein dehydrogenase